MDIPDDELLERLVALNHERAAEEARGEVRWLRPPDEPAAKPAAQQAKLPSAAKKTAKLGWPTLHHRRFRRRSAGPVGPT